MAYEPNILETNQQLQDIAINTNVTSTTGATTANQTNGQQKTKIVDNSGNAVGVTANALDINIKSSGTSLVVTQPVGQNLHIVIDNSSSTSSTATITVSPTITTSSVQIIASNPNRRGLYLYNNSANTVYIAFGSAANSGSNLTIPIATFATYVLTAPVYTGAIFGIRNSGTGTVVVTELT